MEKIKGSPTIKQHNKIVKSLLREKLINGNTIKKQISKLDQKDFQNLIRLKSRLGSFLKDIYMSGYDNEKVIELETKTNRKELLSVIETTASQYIIDERFEHDMVVPSIEINIWKELLNNMILTKIWKW